MLPQISKTFCQPKCNKLTVETFSKFNFLSDSLVDSYAYDMLFGVVTAIYTTDCFIYVGVANASGHYLNKYSYSGTLITSTLINDSIGIAITAIIPISKTSLFQSLSINDDSVLLLLVTTDTIYSLSYKGVLTTLVTGTNFGQAVLTNTVLYVINNSGNANSQVYTFDHNLNCLSYSFTKSTIVPANYIPYGITIAGNNIYVSYVSPSWTYSYGESSLAVGINGSGYIDLFSNEGQLISNFIESGYLNNPTVLFIIGSKFGYNSCSLGVINGGDGTISVYNSSGVYLGKLISKDGSPINVGNAVAASLSYDKSELFVGQLSYSYKFTDGTLESILVIIYSDEVIEL